MEVNISPTLAQRWLDRHGFKLLRFGYRFNHIELNVSIWSRSMILDGKESVIFICLLGDVDYGNPGWFATLTEKDCEWDPKPYLTYSPYLALKALACKENICLKGIFDGDDGTIQTYNIEDPATRDGVKWMQEHEFVITYDHDNIDATGFIKVDELDDPICLTIAEARVGLGDSSRFFSWSVKTKHTHATGYRSLSEVVEHVIREHIRKECKFLKDLQRMHDMSFK